MRSLAPIFSPLLVSLLLAPACSKKAENKASEPASEAKVETQPEAEEAKAVPEPSAAHASESGIQWIDNDYAAALSQARAENKPLVIDMWADWCHTCLAMQKGTLSDRGLSRVSGDFVWLAVDTEDPSTAQVMAKFPPKVWPTFFVVSPGDEMVQATQLGSCSVGAFRDFLDRGAKGHLASLEGTLTPSSPLFHMREGDRHFTNANYQKAAAAYGKARVKGGAEWSHRAGTLKNQISALSRLEDQKACAALGDEQIESMSKERSSSAVDFIYYAQSCAKALEESAAKSLRERALAGLDAILADPEAALSYDDRSDALGTSRGIADELGLSDKARAYAVQQQSLLNKAVQEAGSALEEMTYVWHQVEVHAYLNEGEKILSWVETLEERLPNEYDPPYRKAWLLLKMGRHADAHGALQPALPLALAGRRGRILSLDADIYKAEGNLAKERELRQATVAHYEGLPEGQKNPKALDKARQTLAALDAPSPAPKP